MKPIYFMCAMLGLALTAGSALGQSQSDAKTQAAAHFDRGLELARRKAYVEAVGEFNRAYELSPHYGVMYNLGQAYAAAEQPTYAIEALRRYLAEGKAAIPRERRQQVEATIVEQERRTATLTLLGAPQGTAVRVDGRALEGTLAERPIRVDPGTHVVDAFLPGHEPWQRTLALTAGEQRRVEVMLRTVAPVAPVAVVGPTAPVPLPPAPVATPPAAPPGPIAVTPPAPVSAAPTAPGPTGGALATTMPAPLPAPAPAPKHGRKIAAGIVGGLGVASLAVGSVFGLRAFAKKSSSDDHCPNEVCSAEGVALNDQARTAATVSTISFGVGLAGVAVATYLLLRPGSSPPPTTLARTLRVAPAVGAGQAGVSVGGAW